MREYELEVLEQYDIEIISTRKVRGAYFCDTKEGPMLLKEAGISAGRAPLMYFLLHGLENEYAMKVDTPVFTREGRLFAVASDGTRYLLKKWFSGKECDVRKEREIYAAAAELALLHKRMDWPHIMEYGGWTAADMGRMIQEENGETSEEQETPVRLELMPSAGKMMSEELRRHNRELRKVRTFMRSRVKRSEFEYRFLENFDRMYEIACRVAERMEHSGYPELYRESVEKGLLVHGDYNYHNVMILQGETAAVNFEHFRVGVQVQDLYYFLRKVMEKYQWQERVGKQIMHVYESIRPLEDREREILALCLSYPEKFWKTANAYSGSNKAWLPEKSVEKLETAVGQMSEKVEFLEDIFTFHL